MSRILVLATSARARGGIERYTRHLIRSLHDLRGPGSVRVQFLWRKTSPPSLLEKGVFVLSALRQIRNFRPDLVLCTHVRIAPLALLGKRWWGVPYYGIIAYGDEVWGETPRRALREADVILSISRFTADRLIRRHGVRAEAIRVLPPALDPDLLCSPISPEEVRERHGLRGRRVVLTVGRLGREAWYKGYDVVLRALARLRPVWGDSLAYVIVGDGDDRPRLERLVREWMLEDLVRFAGDVEDAWLPAYYQSCDIFVMPSRVQLVGRCHGEGFGIVYLEAAAFGKPAIAGRDGGSAEAVLDGVTGLLVDPQDPDDVARALDALLRDEAERARLGQQARARVLREFTLERFRERLAAILGGMPEIRRDAPADQEAAAPERVRAI